MYAKRSRVSESSSTQDSHFLSPACAPGRSSACAHWHSGVLDEHQSVLATSQSVSRGKGLHASSVQMCFKLPGGSPHQHHAEQSTLDSRCTSVRAQRQAQGFLEPTSPYRFVFPDQSAPGFQSAHQMLAAGFAVPPGHGLLLLLLQDLGEHRKFGI